MTLNEAVCNAIDVLLEEFEYERVKSSNVRIVGYDPVEHILQLQFHSGGIYNYYDVPKSVYKRMLQASSKGQFAHRKVYPYYEYERIE